MPDNGDTPSLNANLHLKITRLASLVTTSMGARSWVTFEGHPEEKLADGRTVKYSIHTPPAVLGEPPVNKTLNVEQIARAVGKMLAEGNMAAWRFIKGAETPTDAADILQVAIFSDSRLSKE